MDTNRGFIIEHDSDTDNYLIKDKDGNIIKQRVTYQQLKQTLEQISQTVPIINIF